MEHIVDAGSLWQLKLVDHFTDALEHLIRPEVLGANLDGGVVADRGSRALIQTQPYLVADGKVQLSVVLVVCCLHYCLSLQQPVFDITEEDVTIPQLVLHRCNPRGSRLEWDQRWGLAAVDDLEWGSLQRRLIRRVVAVLSPWQPLEPAFGAVAGKAAEIYCDDPVRHFRLAVHLRVEGGAQPKLGPTEAE
jgi:hypothetical protein